MIAQWLFGAAFVLTQIGGVTTAVAADAVSYQIDVAHSGRANLQGFTGHLKQAWTRNLGEGISYPVIAGGDVYVTVVNGSETTLYALDAIDGTTMWQAAIPGQYPVSSLAYDAGQIFVLNADGLLEAFDAATGTQKWSKQMGNQWEWYFPWPPIATGGTVFIGGEGSGGAISAVSEKTGHRNWRSYLYGATSPVAYGKFVATTTSCEDYYGFAAKTGEWLWTDETLYSSGLVAITVYYHSKLFVRDGCTASFQGFVVDAKSGVIGDGFSADLAPSFYEISGTEYIVALASGTLSSTPVGSSTPQWTFKGDGKLSSAPLVINSYVVEGSTSGNLYVLNQADGSKVSSYNVGSSIETPQEGSNRQPLTGLGAGDGVLVVPAGPNLVAFTPK